MQILTHKLSFLLIFSSTIAFAQFDDVFAVARDLVFLTEQYVSPAAEASVYQSSGGWYTSAKKKKLWDIEISVQGNLFFIPKKSNNFLIEEALLDNIKIQGEATTALTPTAIGGLNTVRLEGTINGDTFQLDSPEGINESYLKHAQVQASVGLWEGTSLIVRYAPKIKIDKTYFESQGIGLQNNISQWISPLNDATFNLAGLVSYTIYSVSDTFSEINLPVGSLNSVIVDGQSFMVNIIGSKQVDKFIFSSAIGLVSSKFEFEIGGDGEEVLATLNQTLDDVDISKTNFKADLGVDYNFYNFSVNTMLTFGSYTNLIFGVNYNL